MIEYISQPWPWYVSGFGISVVMFLLLWTGRRFGVSSTLKSLCTIAGAGEKVKFFDFNWKEQIWGLMFVGGAIIGGFIANQFLNYDGYSSISENTISSLAAMNIPFNKGFLPKNIFSWEGLTTFRGIMSIVVGGFLVGFGSRYAGGCTSGHAISGLSNFQLPSLIAVIGFFLGGLLMTHLLMPLIF